MKKSLLVLVIFGAFTATAAVQANDIGATAEIGSTGVGVHIVVPVKNQLNARFGFNVLNHNYSTDTKSAHYDVSLRPRAFDALLDYYPAAGSFRVTGGLVYNKNNKYDVTGTPVVATKYTFVGTLDFNKVAPYVGIGWGNAVAKDKGKGWGFTADAGVLFQGTPETSLTSPGCTASAAACARLASGVAAENAALQDKVNNFKYFPVLRVGVSYRF